MVKHQPPQEFTLDEIGAELVKAEEELPKEDLRVEFASLMYLQSIPVGGLGKIGAK